MSLTGSCSSQRYQPRRYRESLRTTRCRVSSSRESAGTEPRHSGNQRCPDAVQARHLQPDQAHLQEDIGEKRQQEADLLQIGHTQRKMPLERFLLAQDVRHRAQQGLGADADGSMGSSGRLEPCDKDVLQLGAANPPAQPIPAARQTSTAPLRASTIHADLAGRGWGDR